MIDERCLGPRLDRSKIAPDAEVTGSSYLTGKLTSVAAGAVVRDSRLHDATIEAGARITDSILVAEGEPHSHKCDAAGRLVVTGARKPRVAPGATVSGCTLVNCEIGEGSVLRDTWATDVRFGPQNTITDAKLIITKTGPRVTVTGPTEVSEAWLGDGTTIDERGYYEGVFSNIFRVLRFDSRAGRLKVVETIQMPHVSRYGKNTVNSTNSGKILPQPNRVIRGLGLHRGLWKFGLLSHEQIELGPCCLVAPWTKVIGQSAQPHASDEDLVNDSLMTYLMPFSVAGVGGTATNGLVMPGELSTGFGPKQRKGAWLFTYAPDAVIAMVARLHEALKPERKAIADTIVPKALQTALALTESMAARNDVDLSVPHADQKRGWPRWIATTHALLTAHLAGGLWEFSAGRPAAWKLQSGKWTHPNLDAILTIAPDALDGQLSEEDIFSFDDPVPPVAVAVPSGAVEGTGADAVIDPSAHVANSAFVGPGCRIGANVTIASRAMLWNSVLDNCAVGVHARVERSVISGGFVHPESVVRSSRLNESSIGRGSTVDSASIIRSNLAGPATVGAFGDIEDVQADFATIIGGAFKSADVDAYLMSMHMCGGCAHLRVFPRPVTVDERKIELPAIPMIGGGSLIRGTAESPVEMECSFIGSNAIIEPGAFVGFGCFVLGTLGPDEGLPPFTVSTGGGPARQQIGSVITAMASTAITHFVEWTYQAVDPERFGGKGSQAVAAMMRSAVAEGTDALEWELRRRTEGGDFYTIDNPFRRYRNLPLYSRAQLENGLSNYRSALEQGCWDMQVQGRELVFSSRRGRWQERGGTAIWRADG